MLGLRRGNWHSTLVAWAKIILPLLALVALSTLFFFSRGRSPEDVIPYSSMTLEDRLREPKLTKATFAGMTQDGAAVTLKADEAIPGIAGTPKSGEARRLTGLIETPDGVRTTLVSALAALDQPDRLVMFSGGVTLDNSIDYHIETDELVMSLDRTHLESRGKVTATAPMGSIEAGKLVMNRSPDGSYKLDFTGGVRLLYQPPTPG